MLTATDFWHLIEHIIPVYVIILLGYGLTRLNIMQTVHAPGINRWVSIMGVPTYVIQLLAFNDPYTINLKLVGADVMQKILALALGCLWWRFTKAGSIDNVIYFFMLATLPNTVLIGDALLQPLYGEEIHGRVVTIIFLQGLIWYNLCIALYELRVVLLEVKAATEMLEISPAMAAPLDNNNNINKGDASSRNSISILVVANPHPGDRDKTYKVGHHLHHVMNSESAAIERTLSAPARVSLSTVFPFPNFSGDQFSSATKEDTFQGGVTASGLSPAISFHDSNVMKQDEVLQCRSVRASAVLEDHEAAKLESSPLPEQQIIVYTRAEFAGMVVVKVLNRIKYSPLTYGSMVGFVYSLFAYKYHWTMPYPIKTSLELISLGAIGMAIFILGMAWAKSGRLISCGLRTMTQGMLIRFLVGPLLMVAASLTAGLKGTNLKFAILQAVIPQGVISFVLAKEYNLDVDPFCTAVIFQLLIFLPIVLAYYYVLDSL